MEKLNEELLIEWTNLRGRELSLFYLSFKQYKLERGEKMYWCSLDELKKEILIFLDKIKNEKK